VKHIFINHSNITRLIILNLINDRKLDKNDCIIINLRNQNRIKDNQFIQPMCLFPYVEKYRYHRLIILFLALILKFQIKFLTRGKFTLYAPNYAVEFVRAISILSNCVCLNQIEDGFVNYKYTVEQCKNLFYIKSKGRFENFFDSSGLVNKNCKKYYCIDENAFVGQPFVYKVNRNILEGFSTKVELDSRLNIFIFEPISKYCLLEEHQKTILKFLEITKNDSLIVYFKFHPEQSKKEIKEFKKFIKSVSQKKTVYLDESIEVLLLKHSDVLIHSKISTLLIYQYIFTGTKGWCYEIYNNQLEKSDFILMSQYSNLIKV
jgi:hypothetical protein